MLCGCPQIGVQCFAFIKHEATALVVAVTSLFKIFQNSAIQLINALKACALHQNGRLFATDATGAKGHHCFSLERFCLTFNNVREIAEFFDSVVNGIFKAAEICLKRVSGVDQDNGTVFIVLTLA